MVLFSIFCFKHQSSNSGPGLWVLSQVLLLVYFKMDNGSNVCGVEFNYNNNSSGTEENNVEEESKSIIGANESEHEDNYNKEIFRQLFFGFEVKSEEGRSVHLCPEHDNPVPSMSNFAQLVDRSVEVSKQWFFEAPKLVLNLYLDLPSMKNIDQFHKDSAQVG